MTADDSQEQSANEVLNDNERFRDLDYSWVCVRYDWADAATRSATEYGWGEIKKSIPLTLPEGWTLPPKIAGASINRYPGFDSKRVVHALFVKSKAFSTLLGKKGWQVMTKQEFLDAWRCPAPKPKPESGSLVGRVPDRVIHQLEGAASGKVKPEKRPPGRPKKKP